MSELAPAADAIEHPRLQHHFHTMRQQKEASTLGMWTFLVTEIMFFGALFLLYTVYRILYAPGFADASRELDISWGFINTLVLIGSSFTMALAVHSAAAGARRAIAGWLVATVLLGGVFLGVKAVEYHHKFEHHLVPGPHFEPEHLAGSTPADRAESKRQQAIYFSLYFGMTGLHAAHMVIGIPLLLIVAARAYRGAFSATYYTPVELVGLYWHFVDIIWIFLFPLLYLIDPGARH